MGYLNQVLHTYLFKYCPATGMNKNGGEGLPSIILAGQVFFSKIAHNSRATWYNLIKFCILIHLTLSRYRYAKR